MTGVVAGSRPNGNATELPLTPVCPAPPPVPAELPAVSSEVSTVFAPPVAVASLSARRSEATPFGSNPVAPTGGQSCGDAAREGRQHRGVRIGLEQNVVGETAVLAENGVDVARPTE